MFSIGDNKVVYKENNEEVAYVLFSKKDDKTISIDKVFVRGDKRGRGIASKMLEYTYDYFTKKNVKINYECSYSKKWNNSKNWHIFKLLLLYHVKERCFFMNDINIKLNLYFDFGFDYEVTIDKPFEIAIDMDANEKGLTIINEELKKALESGLEYITKTKKFNKRKLKRLEIFMRDKLKVNSAFKNLISSVNFYTNDLNKVYNYIKTSEELNGLNIIIACTNLDDNMILNAKNLFKNRPNVKIITSSNRKEHEIKDLEKTTDIINKIVDEIKMLDLSPIEQIMYSYDIVRNRIYKAEDSGNKWYSSRDLTDVLLGDKIVCEGYANVFNEILTRLGFKASYYCLKNNNNPSNGHIRNMVYIKDDKYNINGVYLFDPTWDSKKSDRDTNFLCSYLFFAKTFIEMKKFDDERNLSSTNIPSFNEELFDILEEKISSDKLEDLSLDDIKTFNSIAALLNFDERIPTLFSLSKQKDIFLPDALIKKFKANKSALLKYNTLFKKITDNELPAEVLLSVLYNVRKKEYYLNERLYPFSLVNFYITSCLSNWRFNDTKEAMFLKALDCYNVKTMNAKGIKRYNDANLLDKKIEMIKLAKTLRKAYEKKKITG